MKTVAELDVGGATAKQTKMVYAMMRTNVQVVMHMSVSICVLSIINIPIFNVSCSASDVSFETTTS